MDATHSGSGLATSHRSSRGVSESETNLRVSPGLSRCLPGELMRRRGWAPVRRCHSHSQVAVVNTLRSVASASFARWRDRALRVQTSAVGLRATERCLRRLSKRQLAKAMAAWRQREQASVFGLRTVERCLRRLSRRYLGRAMQLWCRGLDAVRCLEHFVRMILRSTMATATRIWRAAVMSRVAHRRGAMCMAATLGRFSTSIASA